MEYGESFIQPRIIFYAVRCFPSLPATYKMSGSEGREGFYESPTLRQPLRYQRVNKPPISCRHSQRWGVSEMFDLVHLHTDDKTLSRGEHIETRDFNLPASSGCAELKPA